MNKKTIAKGIGIVFIVFFLFIAFGVFTYHFGSFSDSPDLPNPESPMLYSSVREIILDTPVLIKALGLKANESYAVQYSGTEIPFHNWTAYGEEYNFVVKFEYKHKLGDFVFLYLYNTNDLNQVIDTLPFIASEVDG